MRVFTGIETCSGWLGSLPRDGLLPRIGRDTGTSVRSVRGSDGGRLGVFAEVGYKECTTNKKVRHIVRRRDMRAQVLEAVIARHQR